MRKKLLASVLVAAMATTMLAGCGSTEDNTAGSTAPAASTEAASATESAATTTVAADAESIVSAPTELTFIFADGDEGAKASMNEIVNRFNAAYPDITVTIEPGNGGAYSEFIKTKDSVGEFPDVMEMRDTAMYVRAGKLEPLSEEITSLFRTTTEFNCQVYTAPLSGENTQGIIYNKKYFDDNGLTEPTTYSKLGSAASIWENICVPEYIIVAISFTRKVVI